MILVEVTPLSEGEMGRVNEEFEKAYNIFGQQIKNHASRFIGLYNFDIQYVESLMLECLLYSVRRFVGELKEKMSLKTLFWRKTHQVLFNLQKEDRALKRQTTRFSVSLDERVGEGLTLEEHLGDSDGLERDVMVKDLMDRIQVEPSRECYLVALIYEGYKLSEIAKMWYLPLKDVQKTLYRIQRRQPEILREQWRNF